MLPFLRTALPRPEEWMPFLEASYKSGRFTNFGPCVSRLESELSARFGGGMRQAVLVSSCTAGLSLTLQALGIRGRVALPSFTFPATAHAVLAAGCDPIFVDVDSESWELDPKALEACLASTPGIGAVIHVRSFGFCRDLSPVERVCRRAGVPLVIDAAAAFGGRIENSDPVGLQGDAEVFSFHATKVFGIGEGGAVLAQASLVRSIRRASNFGLSDGSVIQAGTNGKLSEFAAAVGLAVLDRLGEALRHRRSIAHRYAAVLSSGSAVRLPARTGLPSWQTFPICMMGETLGDAAALAMCNSGIEVRRYYSPALHRSPYFSGYTTTHLEVSEWLSDRMICLPIYSDMTTEEEAAVTSAVSAMVRRG